MFSFGTKKAGKLEETVATDDQIIDAVAAALMFDGMNPVITRSEAVKRMPIPHIVAALTAYVMTGNALVSRVSKGKVVDKPASEGIMAMLKAYKIMVKAKRSTDLTLPRLAIAFPLAVYVIRSKIKATPRVTTTTPWELQDLCFNGYLSIAAVKPAEDFINKFSLILNAAANKTNMANKLPVVTDADALLKLAGFREIATLAMPNDPMHLLMTDLSIVKDKTIGQILESYGAKRVVATVAPAVSKPATKLNLEVAEVEEGDAAPETTE